MLVNVCIAKLHRATVTDADLNYVGSVAIDHSLLTAAGLLPGQMATINNVSNAVSWRTYIVKGKKGDHSPLTRVGAALFCATIFLHEGLVYVRPFDRIRYQ